MRYMLLATLGDRAQMMAMGLKVDPVQHPFENDKVTALQVKEQARLNKKSKKK